MTYELTTCAGDFVESFDTFEAAEAHARTLLGVKDPVKTGPHMEHDEHQTWSYFMSAAHERAVKADAGEGGLTIHAFEADEA
jgi:hypothetical protein